MSNLTLISKRFDALQKLAEKEDTIVIRSLRKEFRPDLQRFIIGQTLTMKNGEPAIGKNLYKRWLKKIKTSGFCEEIKFR